VAVKSMEKKSYFFDRYLGYKKYDSTFLCSLAFISMSSKNLASVLWLFRVCPL